MPRRPSLYRSSSGYYRATIDGRKHSFGRDYQAAARRFADTLSRSSWEQSRSTAAPYSIAEALDRWYESRHDRTRLMVVRNTLLTLSGRGTPALPLDSPVAELNQLVREFAERAGKLQYAPSVVVGMVVRLRHFFRWCRASGWVTQVPDRPPSLPRPAADRRYLSSTALSDLLTKLDNPKIARLAAITRFLLFTGCRPSEACNLLWSEVDLAAGVCIIPPSKSKTGRATGRPRTLYLTQQAAAVLSSLPKRADGHVFTSARGARYNHLTLRQLIDRHFKIYPYQLRHTFAMRALDTQPLEVVSALLGHTKVSTTQIYAHIRESRALAAAKSLTFP